MTGSESIKADACGRRTEAGFPEQEVSSPDKDSDSRDEGLKGWTVLIGCCTAMLATYGITGSIGILQVFWIQHQLNDRSQNAVSWITGLNLFLNLFLPACIGPAFDRYGTRLILGLGSICYVLSFFLLGECKQYWHFMLDYGLLNGISSACISTMALSTPAQWFHKRRGLALGIVCAASSVGGICIPFLLDYTLAELPFPWAMRILALMTLVLLAIANVCMIERIRSQGPWRAVRLRWLTNARFMWTTLGTAFFEFVLFNSISLIPSYAAGQGFTTSQASTAIAMLNAGSACGRLFAGWASDRLGRFNIMVCVLAYTTIITACIWMFVYHSLAKLHVSIILFGAGSGSIISLAGVCFGQLCTTEEYGECWGTAYLFVSIAVLISVPTGDALLSRLGGQGYVACSAGVLGAAFIAFLTARWLVLGRRWTIKVKPNSFVPAESTSDEKHNWSWSYYSCLMTTSNNAGWARDEYEETTPLLERQGNTCSSTSWPEAISEFKCLLKAAAIITSGYFLQQSLQIVSILIIGRVSPQDLSVAAFSYMIANTTAWLVAIGGTTAIDSLGSAVFVQGEDIARIGVLLQKYFITVSVMFIPVATLWCFCGPILVLLNVPVELAYGSQRFLRALCPFAVGYIVFEALKKFLQCQEIDTPPTVILIGTAILNAPISYLLVHVWGWGAVGGAIATGSMYWLSAILAFLYIWRIDGNQAWNGWSKECLDGLWKFSKVVLLGIVNIGAEWWAFEIITVGAAAMGEIPAAAQSTIMTTDSLLALFPFGAGVATTNHIAKLQGLGKVNLARTIARMASGLAVCSGCIIMLLLLVFKREIAQIYTNDRSVIDLAVKVFPWAAAFQVSDGLQAVNAGALRAVGKVNTAATINLMAYYVIAIPLCYLLAFKVDLGLSGLWISLALSLTMAGLSEFFIVASLDWRRLAIKEER
ncbi:multidrug resistance pump [Aspergillus flavus]|nr:multidrug resistance pump [Aspergillus flavus]